MQVCFAELAFRGWFPAWLAALMALAAVVSVALLYRREAGRIGTFPRAVMAFFRAAALCVLLFLLLRPTIVMDARGERPRPVVLLVDDSQSMTTRDIRANVLDRWRVALAFGAVSPEKPAPAILTSADLPAELPDRPSRLEVAVAALKNDKLRLLAKLAELGPLQPSSFGLRRIGKDPRDANWIASLAGKEPRTALVDATNDLLQRDENELPAAIVLVTDGRDNASERSFEDLARACARLKVPLHIYGVGSSSYGQLQVREASAPETLFVDDTVSVPVRYLVRGFKEGKVELVVKLNGQEVARKTVDLKEGDDLKEVLSFVPQQKDAQPGKQELTTTARVISSGENVEDGLTRSVRIVDRKVKVLVVDSTPRWDFKFLQRALLRDRRVVASFLLTEADPRTLKSGAPFVANFPATRPELFAYDLLILGDVPAGSLNPDQQLMVREFVAEGGGLIHIAGRNHGPASFVGTPLADALPVEFPVVKYAIDSGERPEPFLPELTPAGTRSTILSLTDDPLDNLRVWKTLPPIYWAYPVTKLKPASEAYLVHPKKTLADGKPMPLLAAHFYGKGYAIWVGFDETWRWRFNEADRYFGRFWSQTVYVAGVPRTLGTKLTQLSLDTADPQLGKVGQVYARLFAADLKPLAADRIEARLERLDAGPEEKDRSTPVDLKALPGQLGEYIATIPFNRVGRFALKIDNAGEPAALEYRVALPPDHELSPGGINEEELRKLAEATGGGFYREENLFKLVGAVVPQSTPFVQREEYLLWNKWALFLVIGLFVAEWFVRKFSSLS